MCKPRTAFLFTLVVFLHAAAADASPLPYSDDPGHPWNRLHRALFDRQVEVGRPPCALEHRGCGDVSPTELFAKPSVGVKVTIGGDAPLPFIGGDVWFLEDKARNDEVLAAIRAARTIGPRTQPLAAVLLQADCWERFDAIVDALTYGMPKDRQALERLLPPLAALIHHLALPRATLAKLPDGQRALAAHYPTLVPGLTTGDGWLEIRSEYTDGPNDRIFTTTRHSERQSFRSVFRVLVRAAPGAAWLRTNITRNLKVPDGTILLILGSPVAIAADGELVPTALVTVAEVRVATKEAPTTVARLPYHVVELTRRGTFARLAPDAFVPMGGTCMPNRTTEVPMAAACLQCHAATAPPQLTGPFAHGDLMMLIEDDPNAAAGATTQAKRLAKDFARLRALW